MKKLLVMTLALGSILALTACGAEITLVPTTTNGISIDMPSDFGAFAEKDGAMIAANKDETASVSVSVAADAGETKPADIDQEMYQQLSYPGTSDVEFVAYDNASTCNGIPAIYANCKLKNANGVSVMAYSYLLFHEDGTIQGVSINYNTDVESSVTNNVDAIRKSIKKK